jgi:two-component system, OmpR family, heavy metal sensor histidine kinase CusS
VNISFRTRLFFFAALIVGAVLALVLGLGWRSVLKVEVDRLNERLCMEARRIATQPFDAKELSRLEADVALKLRLGASDQVLVRFDEIGFEARAGGTALQSAGWRNAPRLEDLTWAAARFESGPTSGESRLMPPPGERREGRRASEAEPLQPREPPGSPGTLEGRPGGTCSLASFIHLDHDWQAARFDAQPGRAVVAADLASVKADLQSAVQRALTLIIPLVLMLTAAGAWLLASLSLRPVNRLRSAMKGVTKNALDQRLPSAGEDREFNELIADYNTMLARLEASFNQASRFSADAAHEIKTPLTILQGRLEHAISLSDNRAIQDDLTAMLDEVGRLTTITRKLLWLSQADAGKLALQRALVPLTKLLDELMLDAHMLVTSQSLRSDIARGLRVQGDVMLLRQLFNNLLNNAVRYSPPSGWVAVRAVMLPGSVEVKFSNATTEVSAEVRARFFERFFRADAAHHSQVEGSGLGLSLAREIARAHGGDLTLEAGPLNEVTLRLWLPA